MAVVATRKATSQFRTPNSSQVVPGVDADRRQVRPIAKHVEVEAARGPRVGAGRAAADAEYQRCDEEGSDARRADSDPPSDGGGDRGGEQKGQPGAERKGPDVQSHRGPAVGRSVPVGDEAHPRYVDAGHPRARSESEKGTGEKTVGEKGEFEAQQAGDGRAGGDDVSRGVAVDEHAGGDDSEEVARLKRAEDDPGASAREPPVGDDEREHRRVVEPDEHRQQEGNARNGQHSGPLAFEHDVVYCDERSPI